MPGKKRSAKTTPKPMFLESPQSLENLNKSSASHHDHLFPIAISCGLLLNELLTNALKYAFPQADASQPDLSAEIRVTLQRINAETVELQVSDNGMGLPEDFDLDHLKSLGLSLVTMFVQRLQGTFEVTSEHGTRWRIRFPQPS